MDRAVRAVGIEPPVTCGRRPAGDIARPLLTRRHWLAALFGSSDVNEVTCIGRMRMYLEGQ
jgi:hypothetical protein